MRKSRSRLESPSAGILPISEVFMFGDHYGTDVIAMASRVVDSWRETPTTIPRPCRENGQQAKLRNFVPERSHIEAYYQCFEPATFTSNTQTQKAAAHLGRPPRRLVPAASSPAPSLRCHRGKRRSVVGFRWLVCMVQACNRPATWRETLLHHPYPPAGGTANLLQKPEQVNLWYCYLAATSQPSTMEKKPKKDICIAYICSPRLTITRLCRHARI